MTNSKMFTSRHQEINIPPDLQGPLEENEVEKLRAIYGYNTIKTGSKRNWYHILFAALFHPFNILLTLLAVTSAVTEEYQTMGIMLIMVLLSTSVRFHQEWKSEVVANTLLEMIETDVVTIRNVKGVLVDSNVPSHQLVPGDWIKLNPGDLVPADSKIIESKDFHVSQAVLTGEGMPVLKSVTTTQFKISSDNMKMTASDLQLTPSLLLAKKKKNRPPSCFSLCLKKIFGLPVTSIGGEMAGVRDSENGMMVSELDQPELCFMGSAVVSGAAVCVVVHTGSRTYFGKMASELAKRRPQNAFQLGVRRISWIFFVTMICFVPPVLLLQGFIHQNWKDAFIFALSVAVGLTPEMLPMIVNTTLAKGAMEMSKKHCIVKKLDAIINMGGIDVLCTDKTGTLTKSTVTVHSYLNHLGALSSTPLFFSYLNSHFQSVHNNPIDSAVTIFFEEMLEDGKIQKTDVAVDISNKFSILDELPFDFVRRRMSVILTETEEQPDGQKCILICKGAVEEVVCKCTTILTDTTTPFMEVARGHCETQQFTPEMAKELTKLNEDLNNDGLRVIAVAYKSLANRFLEEDFSLEDESELTFAGFLTFLDPPKESTKDAIKNLQENNIAIKVLTGDSSLVCRKICIEIGLSVNRIVTGTELVGLTSKELSILVEEASIFAKLTPIQKSDVVHALKNNGHIVGFLGDGINDAVGLTEADVGISVDGGTVICKEYADIILLEKDLTVVVDSVITGRTTYGNTLKYIVMTVSSNFGNVFSILVASAWLNFQPMSPLHILVQNLLYDISQITIPWDHMDQEFLKVPHRWSMKSVMKFMVMIGPWSSVFDITTFLFMYFYFGIKTDGPRVPVFQTAWFTVGLLTQIFIVHMIRTPKIPFFQSWASSPVICMTLTIMVVGLAIPYVPELSKWLNLVPLPWEFYPFLGAVLFSYCCAAQIAKTLYLWCFKEWY